MKALLFPGQSSQFCGMALDLYEHYSEVRDLFNLASDIADFDIANIISHGSDLLDRTEYLQIAVFVASLACFRVLELQRKINLGCVKYILGHSLGEYTALHIAGSISFEDSIKILKKRALLMASASAYSNKKLSMASVLGVDLEKVRITLNKFFKETREEEDIFIANYNTDSQIVLSGNLDTIEKFKLFAKNDIRKIVNLPVSGAFHSVFMKEASIEFAKFLEDFKINDSEIEIIMNNNAIPERRSGVIRKNLIENLTSGVLWWPSIKLAIKNGVSQFIQIGGKEILINMIKKENIANLELSFVNSLETINNFH